MKLLQKPIKMSQKLNLLQLKKKGENAKREEFEKSMQILCRNTCRVIGDFFPGIINHKLVDFYHSGSKL